VQIGVFGGVELEGGNGLFLGLWLPWLVGSIVDEVNQTTDFEVSELLFTVGRKNVPDVQLPRNELSGESAVRVKQQLLKLLFGGGVGLQLLKLELDQTCERVFAEVLVIGFSEDVEFVVGVAFNQRECQLYLFGLRLSEVFGVDGVLINEEEPPHLFELGVLFLLFRSLFDGKLDNFLNGFFIGDEVCAEEPLQRLKASRMWFSSKGVCSLRSSTKRCLKSWSIL
jgi:hypothetical protein